MDGKDGMELVRAPDFWSRLMCGNLLWSWWKKLRQMLELSWSTSCHVIFTMSNCSVVNGVGGTSNSDRTSTSGTLSLEDASDDDPVAEVRLCDLELFSVPPADLTDLVSKAATGGREDKDGLLGHFLSPRNLFWSWDFELPMMMMMIDYCVLTDGEMGRPTVDILESFLFPPFSLSLCEFADLARSSVCDQLNAVLCTD